MNKHTILLALLALAGTATVTAAGQAASPATNRSAVTLKVGEPAPRLQIGKWIQGEPVKAFDCDHAYLIEFWATWCGPCKAAIPHLNELHQKFKDRGFVVIGQNVWETSEPAVGPFVKKMGDKMTYRVALDDKSGAGKGRMADTWLAAAGKNGIPASFLVNKQGTVVWIGHPMELQESMIEAVLAGKFEAKQAVALQQDRTAAQAKTSGLNRDAYAALREKDWTKAESAIAALEKELPENQLYRAGSMRVELLLAQGDQEAAAKLAEKVAAENKGNLFAQHNLASQLARAADSKPVVLNAAERIATRANESLNGNDVSSLVTLARIAFLKGNKEKAVELQTKVVELSKPAARPRMQEFLDRYKAGKLPGDGVARATRPAIGRTTGADTPVDLPPEPK